jgi:flagellar hook assembly protein FlgD
LNTISSSLTGLTLGQYSGMINHTVTANTTSVTVPASGSVSSPMTFDVTASGLSNVNVQITNSAGTVVGSLPVSGSNGTVTFQGTGTNGQALPVGQYNVSLVGTSTAGAVSAAGTLSQSGVVSGVIQGTGGTWDLQIQNGLTVDASSVTSVN